MRTPPTDPSDTAQRADLAEAPHESDAGPSGPCERPYLVLRLYVAGGSPRSVKAIRNVRIACEQHLDVGYDLEVIDLFQQPWRASAAELFAVPTLVKELPLPEQRLVGVFSDPARLGEQLLLCALAREGGVR